MDKYEYKIRSEEIKTLIGRKKFIEAMEIADTIDWRKVKNINMLCTVSDLYKLNRRYEESREILLLAYERYPGGRMIIYSLCELCIKLDDVVHAVEYYKEFVQTSPRDNGRYILQYKLYEAQDVTLEERIAVLEELKRREYIEKWAYELAYLYHRIGLGTKCVEECDELILWFGEGRYVTKAMELKMLHTPLSPDQQKKYNKAKGIKTPPSEKKEPLPASDDDEMDIHVKPMNVGEYATINLQRELAESMKEVLGEEEDEQDVQPTMEYAAIGRSVSNGYDYGMADGRAPIDYTTEEIRDFQTELENNELEIYEEDYQTDEFNTDEFITEETGADQEGYEEDYQEDIYAPQSQLPAYEKVQLQSPVTEQSRPYSRSQMIKQPVSVEGPGEFTKEIISNLLQEIPEEESETGEANEYRPVSAKEEVFFEDPDTAELQLPPQEEIAEPKVVKMSRTSEIPKIIQNDQEEHRVRRGSRIDIALEKTENDIVENPDISVAKTKRTSGDIDEAVDTGKSDTSDAGKSDMDEKSTVIPWPQNRKQDKNQYETLLAQDNDGQIRMAVMPEDMVDRQITGQISFTDILQEWEKVKKENEERRAEAVRQRVKEQTGEIFSQFDASTKEGILAELDALAEETEKEERSSGKKERSVPNVEMDDSLPEIEELEEIEELSATKQFTEETRKAVSLAKDDSAYEGSEKESADEEGPEQEADGEEKENEKVKQKGRGREDSQNKENIEPVRQETLQEEREKPAKNDRPERTQRPMTAEEKKLFGPFIQTKSTKEQILDTLDNISLASYTGNVILTGEAGMGSVKLAKNIIKEIQMSDSNFSGRMAKITGHALNSKDMEKTFSKLSNGALIVEGAGELKESAVKSMIKLLEKEEQGIIVILEDTRINMNKLLDNYKALHQNFNLRIDIEAMDNDSLVLFAKKYALEREYAIDELGVLALYTRISELQTSEHSVTTKEVKEIVDGAIRHAGRKNMSHFMDILLGKRYDDEDMIILREKDFV